MSDKELPVGDLTLKAWDDYGGVTVHWNGNELGRLKAGELRAAVILHGRN